MHYASLKETLGRDIGIAPFQRALFGEVGSVLSRYHRNITARSEKSVGIWIHMVLPIA